MGSSTNKPTYCSQVYLILRCLPFGKLAVAICTSNIVRGGRFTPVATHCCAGYCHLFGEVDCSGIWVVWHQCTSSRGGRKGSTTIVLYHIPTFVAQTDRHIHLSEHPPTRTVSNCTLQSPKCSILERQYLVSTNLLLEIS